MNERVRSVAQGFALAVRQAPGAFTRLLLNVLGGAAPAAVLLIQKVIVDGIAGSTGDTGLMSLLRTPSLLAAAIAGLCSRRRRGRTSTERGLRQRIVR